MEKVTRRIEYMERLFDEVREAVEAGQAMDATLDGKIRALFAYMDEGLWLEDYQRDELLRKVIGPVVVGATADCYR